MKPEDPIAYIVDDDSESRISLVWLLKSVDIPTKEFESGATFLREFDPARPGCVLLDVRMPLMSGFDVQEELNRRGASIPIIFVTGHGDIPMSVRALQNGAIDFVEKPFHAQQMLERVQKAVKLASLLHASDFRRAEIKKRIDSLTARETAVLRSIVEGKSSKETADELAISFKTVDAHRSSIRHKLGASSSAMLMRDIVAVWSPDSS